MNDEDLIKEAMEIVRLLRTGHFAAGSARLQPIMDRWTEIANAELKSRDGVEVALTTQLMVSDFQGAQERGDYLRIADLLEFQILPWVDSKKTR